MNLDYISLRRLELFFSDLKTWLASKYASKSELPGTMAGASQQAAGSSGLVPAPDTGEQGKILTGDGNWSEVEEYTTAYIDGLNWMTQLSVRIGNHDYPIVQIGNQLWLAENLDYKFAYDGGTLPIGGSTMPSTPKAWYYNDDETQYGIDGTYKCGLLYNWYAAKYLEDNKATLLPDGWHVPTTTEWDILATTIGGSSTAGTKLKALNNSVTSNFPSNWGGTDDYGFNALPAGFYQSSFIYLGSGSVFWTSTGYNSNEAYHSSLNTGTSLNSTYYYKTYGYSIRLVKSLT